MPARTILSTEFQIREKKITQPKWYTNLQEFVSLIQSSALSNAEYTISKPEIIPEKKEIRGKITLCRPLALYNYTDRIVISLTAKYLTQIFDPYLVDECCFAFRAPRNRIVITHHDTIKHLINYKKGNPTSEIWVSECDIKKFFDCINQKIIKDVYDTFVDKCLADNIYIDTRATKIFHLYLESYCFYSDVFTKNHDKKYFAKYYIDNGRFDWPEKELTDKYYLNHKLDRIGVPQGGAISCLIANLILHEVDEGVLQVNEKNKYMRFCDDMIILSTSKNSCNQALEKYQDLLRKYKLLVHDPLEIEYYNSSFWDVKSKSPYRWDNPNIASGNVPWVSFVGYQVRYDGLIRIRKKSISKEMLKQKKQVDDVLSALDIPKIINPNITSRKSFLQQVIALESRLISMSVGRVNLHTYQTYKPTLCWTVGFREVNDNCVLKSQLKNLDRNRTYQILRLKKELKLLNLLVHKPDKDSPSRYRGTPFSYFGFLNTKKNLTPPA